ncbi:MAG: hypothetical protein JSY10_25370 [Paenibacillus sp.]|nr:hypothetical protein [Paenibacillus sp.]
MIPYLLNVKVIQIKIQRNNNVFIYIYIYIYIYLATIIAERAAAALKESRRQRRLIDIGTPTWTGRSGTAGAPRQQFNPSSPKFGNKKKVGTDTIGSQPFGSGQVSGFNNRAKVSSSILLAKMKARKEMEGNIIYFFFSVYLKGILLLDISTNLDSTAQESMINKIRDYLSQNDGRGTSQDIMNNLDININQEQVVIFRKMLQAIAKYQKDQTGKGVWVLKKDFV